MAPRFATTFAVLMGLVLSACSVHRYRPVRPSTAHFPGLDARVRATSVAFDWKGEVAHERVSVRTDAAPGTRLRNAAMVRLAEPSCVWWDAAGLVVDDHDVDYYADISGTHELLLTLSPGSANSLANEPAAIELQLVGGGPPRCVRIPLPEPLAWKMEDSWAWGMRFEFVHLPTSLIPGKFSGFGMGFELGRWLGPVRVSFAPSVLVDECDDEVRCEKRSDGNDSETMAFVGKLDLAVYPLQYGILSGAVLGRFERAYVSIPNVGGSSSAGWQGLQGGLRLTLFDIGPRDHPYPRTPANGALELEGSAGPVQVSADGDHAVEMKYGASVLISVPL